VTDFLNSFHGLAAAFYPEHFDQSLWEANIIKIKETGLNAVRIGEFSWDLFEPEEGQYDFGWFNHLFDLLEKHELKVIICTPTASPSLWMCEKYPEILPEMEDGTVFGFGARRHTCPTSEVFKDLCIKITREMVREFGDRESVIGWQIDNELGAPACYCPRCGEDFRKFLAEEFGTIEKFNQQMVTTFWAQTFKSFAEVPVPRPNFNPGFRLAYRKFMSRQWINYFCWQRDVIKDENSQQPVTTNMMPPWHGYDHFKLAEFEDVVGYDMYPKSHPYGNSFAMIAFYASFYRSLRQGQNFWVTEHQVGSMIQDLVLPGEVKYWTWAHIALGADLISYFRWDMPACGQERLHQGIVHPGGGEFRGYDEVKQTAIEIKQLAEDLNGTEAPSSDIGIIFSHESWWNDLDHGFYNYPLTKCSPTLHQQIRFPYHYHCYFKALVSQGYIADFLDKKADFSKYKLIVTPALHCASRNLIDKLTEYVKNGGNLYCCGMPGMLDEKGRVVDNLQSGIPVEILGVEILDWGNKHQEIDDLAIIDRSSGDRIRAGEFLEICRPLVGTETLAEFSEGALAGYSAFTRKKTGKGYGYYLASLLPEDEIPGFCAHLLEMVGMSHETGLPDGVFTTKRTGKSGEIDFIFNSTGKKQKFHLEKEYINLKDQIKVSGKITLEPYAVLARVS